MVVDLSAESNSAPDHPHESAKSVLSTAPAPPVASWLPLVGGSTSWPSFANDAAYRRAFWAVAALGLCVFIPNAGSFGLWDPWETHYGEVTRTMVETNDFVSPWWGFRDKIGTEGVQGSPFFSKPVYLFWIEAIFCRLIGFGEWAIRLPIAIIAWLCSLSMFAAGARLGGYTRVGVLAALVVATSPQFFLLSRQAQTDMPFVGTMTMALAFFAMAAFAPREGLSPRGIRRRIVAVVVLAALSTFPQYAIIASDLSPEPNEVLAGWAWFRKAGWLHGVGYAALMLAWLGWALRSVWPAIRLSGAGVEDSEGAEFRDAALRRAWLWAFYVLCAHATLAKGLLGFMLPGAILFVFLLLTGGWAALKRVELLRGIALFSLVGFPWYGAMFGKFGMAYYNRFFIHDHFNRLGAGVHQIDSGTFEHFIKWLGIGMFPWVAIVPLAAIAVLSVRLRRLDRTTAIRLFAFLWFFVSFTLFTVSSTKFHHYIFPALPPLALLIAFELAALPAAPGPYRRFAAVVGLGIVSAVAWNLRSDVQGLRNLFTYKYDRPLPPQLPTDVNGPIASDDGTPWGLSLFWEDTNPLVLNLLNLEWLDYRTVIAAVGLVALLALLLLWWSRSARFGAALMGVGATALAVYSLNVYMPMLSPHWSQKYIFDRYMQLCTRVDMGPELEDSFRPLVAHMGLGGIGEYFGARHKEVCQEDIISWLITWRGETFYSHNEIRPITKEATQFEAYLRDMNRGRAFFVLIERGKEKSWERRLNTTYLGEKLKDNKYFSKIKRFSVEKVFGENRYFILVRVTPILKEA